jgi:hypothetical protein
VRAKTFGFTSGGEHREVDEAKTHFLKAWTVHFPPLGPGESTLSQTVASIDRCISGTLSVIHQPYDSIACKELPFLQRSLLLSVYNFDTPSTF